jgi:hypothetical protein
LHRNSFWAALVLPVCLGAPPSSSAQTIEGFALAGRVTNSLTGQPVQRAQVAIRAFPPDAPFISRHGLTDPAGAFRFTGLPAAEYEITLRKPQFESDEPRRVAIGPSREHVELRITPLSVVEGTVVDSSRTPLPAVTVELLRMQIRDGFRTVGQDRSVSTDDRGRYRLWNLKPGKYYLRAAGRSGGTFTTLGDSLPRLGWDESAPLTYYGGAHTIAAATAIVVTAGQQIEANLTLATEPAFRIRGTVSNASSDQLVRFHLLTTPEDQLSVRALYSSKTGRFDIPEVVPGLYRLRATQEGPERRRGEVEVRVGTADVNDVTLSLARGTELKGVTNCERIHQASFGIPCPARVLLIDAAGERTYSERDGDNSWAFKGVFPGEYRLRVRSPGEYVASVLSAGRPLSPDIALVIQPGAAAPAVEISTRADGGTLDVSLEIENRPSDVSVLLVRDQPSFDVPQTLTLAKPDYAFAGIAPGNYTAYAFRSLEHVMFTDSEAMRQYSGVKVHVEPNSRQKMVIRSLAE